MERAQEIPSRVHVMCATTPRLSPHPSPSLLLADIGQPSSTCVGFGLLGFKFTVLSGQVTVEPEIAPGRGSGISDASLRRWPGTSCYLGVGQVDG